MIDVCRKMSTDDPSEESIIENFEEEPITEDWKMNLLLRNQNRTLSL